MENSFEIIILAPIAWVSLEDIDLSFKDSVLTISWNREKPDIFEQWVEIKILNVFGENLWEI